MRVYMPCGSNPQVPQMYTRFIGTGFAFFAILTILALAPLVTV